jgi:glutathione S-transferase
MQTFYYSPGACSLGPHIVLEEVGADYQRQIVKAGVDTRTPEWRAINPKGRIPALSGVAGAIGGTSDLLTEASAIMIYVARTHADVGLIPSDPAREARMIEWLNYLSSWVHAATYASIRRPERFVDDASAFPPIQEKGRKTLRNAYGYIEELLGDGRDWAVPGGYTLADIYLFVFYHFGYGADFDMKTAFPVWRAHTEKLLARPAVQRVVAIEGLTLP